MLTIVKRIMRVEVSPKQDINVYKEVEFAGFVGLQWESMWVTRVLLTFCLCWKRIQLG